MQLYHPLAIWHADVWNRPHADEQGKASIMVCTYVLEPPLDKRGIRCIKCPGLAQDQQVFNLLSSRPQDSLLDAFSGLKDFFFLGCDINLYLPSSQPVYCPSQVLRPTAGSL
jgi:hypothetical protein